jgi:hypothetical protein
MGSAQWSSKARANAGTAFRRVAVGNNGEQAAGMADDSDDPATDAPSIQAVVLECGQIVRAAHPVSLRQARELARQELGKRGVPDPDEDAVDEVASFAVTKHPVTALLGKLGRSYLGVYKILRATSQPGWSNAPLSATRHDWMADGELRVYPEVDPAAGPPVFERLYAQLAQRRDRYDGEHDVELPCDVWLDLDPVQPGEVRAHIGRTLVGRLADADVQRLRTAPDHLIPNIGESVAVDAYLIGPGPSDIGLVLFLPFPEAAS